MSATALHQPSAASFEELKPACQILILHEDFAAYLRAVEVCRRVMEQFANELDFDIKCWNFIELADPNCARHAAKTASAADIILLSMQGLGLSPAVDQWLEVSFTARSRAEGALTLVLSEPASPAAELGQSLGRLQELAGRWGMDFLLLRPGNELAVMGIQPVENWPVSTEPLEISDRPQSDHWGLNE